MPMNLGINQTEFTRVKDIKIPDIFYNRLKSGVEDFDKLFGEGLLPGASATLTAQAGCGKTTFLLQLLEHLNQGGYDVAYASGEENCFQLAFTCKRLDVKGVSIANVTDVDTIAEAMEGVDVMVVDSFQALTTKTKMNSRALEQYAISTLCNKAKETECVLFFIMHLTKSGQLKGSTLVPHSVDVNMMISHDLENDDDTTRIISVSKNRFGQCIDVQAILGHKGFHIGEKVTTGKKAKSKKDRKADLKKQILELDPPMITEQRVMSTFSLTKGQTYVALKQLVDDKKLKKFGRGANAVWKKR
jgi:predicted ATP-dependent serine protease